MTRSPTWMFPFLFVVAGCTGERAQTVEPAATGTLAYYPERNVLEVASVGGQIQSSYSWSPDTREFRRGVFEFAIPSPARAHLVSATLVLTDTCGIIYVELPANEFELAYYPADLMVTVADFESAATPLTVFFQDQNDAEDTEITFDVSGEVRAFIGQGLGFRLTIEGDPVEEGTDSYGCTFGQGENTYPRLELLWDVGLPSPSGAGQR